MSGWPTSAPTARRSPSSTGKPHSPKPPEPETTTDAGRRWTGSCRDSRRSSPNGLWSTSALRTASCPTAASRCSVHRSTPSGSGSRCRWPTRSRRSTARRRSSASGNRAASPPRRRSNGNSSRDSPSTIRRSPPKPTATFPRPSPMWSRLSPSSKNTRWRNASTSKNSAARNLRTFTSTPTIRAPPGRSGGASTCTVHGWRPTRVSNAPAATRRNT